MGVNPATMILRGMALVPLLSALCGGASVEAPPLSSPGAPRDVGMADLPLEVRDILFSILDLVDYVRFLTASPGALLLRASAHYEEDRLKRGAERLTRFERGEEECDDDGPQVEDLITGVRILIGLRSGLPMRCRMASRDKLARQFERVHARCESFCTGSLWSATCFAGLIDRIELHSLYAHLDGQFVSRNGAAMMRGAALIGDFETLQFLVQTTNTAWEVAAELVASAIAQGGSRSLFKKILAHASLAPFMSVAFHQLLVKLGRDQLFEHFAKRSRDRTSEVPPQLVETVCELSCVHQRAIMVHYLVKYFPEHLGQLKLSASLRRTIEAGNMEILKTLLWDAINDEKRTNIQLTVGDRIGMLESAVQHGRIGMLEFLLREYKMELGDVRESDLQRIFAMAVEGGHLEAIRLLLQEGPDGHPLIADLGFDSLASDVLGALGRSGRMDVIDEFFRRQAGGDRRFVTFGFGAGANKLLRAACGADNLDFVRFLLQRDAATGNFILPGIDPAADHNDALVLAARRGHLRVVAELLQLDAQGNPLYPGVDPAADDNCMLRVAVACERFPVVEFLLQLVTRSDGTVAYRYPGIDVAVQDDYILRTAVERQDRALLELLLRRDANRRFVLPGMRVPLHLVAPLERLGMV